MTPLIQEIEKEFEKELPVAYFGHDHCECFWESGELSCAEQNQKDVKAFLLSSLQKVIEAERKSVVEECVRLEKSGLNEERESVAEIYNSALSSIAEFIRNKK